MITAVVPMKSLSLAKKRLSGILPDRQRQALVCAMLTDVLHAVQQARHVARCFVLTADPAIAALATNHGAGHIRETAPEGLNSAVTAAARFLEASGTNAMLILPGDVPLVSAGDIDSLISRCGRQSFGIVPAHDGDGTNAMLLSPPGAVTPSFGPGSFERHLAGGRKTSLDPVIVRLERLGRDIDTPEDLDFLRTRTVGRAEYSFLKDAYDPASMAQAVEQRHA